MSDERVGSVATPIVGAQGDFIGKRKRAMHRANKRIPDHPRCVSWRLDRSMRQIMNDISKDLYAAACTSENAWTKIFDGSYIDSKPIPLIYGLAGCPGFEPGT